MGPSVTSLDDACDAPAVRRMQPVGRMTTTHPVQLRVEPAPKLSRIHVVIRVVLLAALGTLGCSSLYWLLYLAAPAAVALVVSQRGSERFLAESAPPIVRALRWLAGAYAYLWLFTDEFPSTEPAPGAPAPRVALEIDAGGVPTPGSALLRLLYSLPALLLLALLSFAATFLWVVAAIWILVAQRAPAGLADFFALTLRYQFRLVAYHLSLTDRYPSLVSASSYTPHSGQLREPA